ncbi:DUF421 domain-containing protein [Paenibacillus humicola]|uniref:YetF domain-containing protein n=1 Tax=Paenibacillus humicola TaxID=3110540 RepID=UPI00237A67B1|nr:DUF421 domain-containing protein [Paenibacillus humicola]
MEIWSILIRTVLTYFVVFLILRFMGKREIGKLSVFDLVISVMIAEIAVIVIEDTDRPLTDGIVPMCALMLIQIGIAFIALKSRTVRLWFDGKPTVLIENGHLNREAMRKQRYNLDDLLHQLRANKIGTVEDVEFAVLETSGKLSILEKDKERRTGFFDESAEHRGRGEKEDPHKLPPPFPEHYRFESLPIPLIMDGKLVGDNLNRLGKDRFWLNNQLKQRGVTDLKQVYLCTIDHKGKLYVDSRNKPGS